MVSFFNRKNKGKKAICEPIVSKRRRINNLWFRGVSPKVHYSEGSLVRRSVCPNVDHPYHWTPFRITTYKDFSTEIDNNFGYEKIAQLVDNIPLIPTLLFEYFKEKFWLTSLTTSKVGLLIFKRNLKKLKTKSWVRLIHSLLFIFTLMIDSLIKQQSGF
jgi:hypothetical protein